MEINKLKDSIFVIFGTFSSFVYFYPSVLMRLNQEIILKIR